MPTRSAIAPAVVLGALTCLAAAHAQQTTPPIQFDTARKVWLITTRANSYALGVDSSGAVQNLYWGAPLWRVADIPPAVPGRDVSSFDPRQTIETEEYPGWGGPRYYEPALKLTRADGNRDLVLKYQSHKLAGNDLDIELSDIRDEALRVTLHYRVYPDSGIVRRHTTIRNATAAPVTLESAQSATLNLPAGTGYNLTWLTGRWASETQVQHQPIREEKIILESRKGHTSHNYNPWFAIDRGGATEESGGVWFGALAWSGNWRITVEQTPYRRVRVTGGLNTFDFEYPLRPGETLETPAFYFGYSANGHGEASRLLHRFEISHILPGGDKAPLRPVLYNSWEATTFNVDEPGQTALADKAAKLGVELFVVDDGWFGARNNDRAGLGDWYVNKKKFPNGLGGLISHVQKLGMKFGLWVEPEMINADSDLYRAHPDWVLHMPDRPRSELRNQMILNLAREDVKEHLFKVLDGLATEYPIAYFKWDMNRSFSEPGWPAVAPADQRKMWVKYVTNYYELLDRLRAKHPNLEIESCSGGGGRIDLGVLRRVDEVWPSDNTDAFDRLRIQEGFTMAYTPKVMSAWVTDVPNMNGRSTPLAYRFLVAMQGALGIGSNLNKFTAADETLATRMVAAYKRIRETVQHGDLYRLASPRDPGGLTASSYVSRDGKQAVLFAFRHAQQFNTPADPVMPRGLDPRTVYNIEAILDGKLQTRLKEASGAWLMNNGLTFSLRGDYDAAAVILTAVSR